MSLIAEAIYQELAASGDHVRREGMNEPDLHEFIIQHRMDQRAEVRVLVGFDRCYANLYATMTSGEVWEGIPLVVCNGDPELISRLMRQVGEWLTTSVLRERMQPVGSYTLP